MLALRKTVKSCTKASSLFRGTQRAYQSTPDPDEKPVINFSKSEGMKKITDKSLPEYNLNKNFALDKPFPGTIVSKGIADSTPPKTLSTVLPNGLTVATQEMPGLMSSFAFLVRTGRYVLLVQVIVTGTTATLKRSCFLQFIRVTRRTKWQLRMHTYARTERFQKHNEQGPHEGACCNTFSIYVHH